MVNFADFRFAALFHFENLQNFTENLEELSEDM